MINQYQQRLLDELNELSERTDDLRSFLAENWATMWHGKASDLMQKQLSIMDMYCEVLRERIDYFGESQ